MNKLPIGEIETQLDALIDRNEAPAIARLDALLAAHREEMPRDLAHYLQRRSYHKARAFLRGELEAKH